LEEGVLEVGGIPSLAHPVAYRLGWLLKFADYGFVYRYYHMTSQERVPRLYTPYSFGQTDCSSDRQVHLVVDEVVDLDLDLGIPETAHSQKAEHRAYQEWKIDQLLEPPDHNPHLRPVAGKQQLEPELHILLKRRKPVTSEQLDTVVYLNELQPVPRRY
jgi:hypothetical protein